MTLDISDLYDAFRFNYHTLQLVPGDNNTTWTHRILGYFDKLGRMLGYAVYFERNRDDLSWWDYSEDEKFFLHLEHENSTNKERIRIERSNKEIHRRGGEITRKIS